MNLFYTSVSHELLQIQSAAFCDDAIHFEKYPGNHAIRATHLGIVISGIPSLL